MTGPDAETIQEGLRNAFAVIALRSAADPGGEQTLRMAFEPDARPITLEEVERRLGAEAASCFHRIQLAASEMRAAISANPEGPPGARGRRPGIEVPDPRYRVGPYSSWHPDRIIRDGLPSGWMIQDRLRDNVALLCREAGFGFSRWVCICLRPRLMSTEAWLPIAARIARGFDADVDQPLTDGKSGA